MNQAQVKYARNRIDEISSQKLKEVQEKYSYKGVSLSFEEKIEEIKAGRFTKGKYEDLSYIVFDAQKDLDKDRREAAKSIETEAIKKFKTQLLDGLMLGDSEEALKAIKDFENFKVGK